MDLKIKLKKVLKYKKTLIYSGVIVGIVSVGVLVGWEIRKSANHRKFNRRKNIEQSLMDKSRIDGIKNIQEKGDEISKRGKRSQNIPGRQ